MDNIEKTKSFPIHNRELGKEIHKAEMAEGYLIMITRRVNNGLMHTFFTQRFIRDDISIALKEQEKLLQKEISKKSTESKEEPKIEEQKELPPEYRKNTENNNQKNE